MHEPTRVEKPWGYELHWAKTDRYVGKVIHITKGHALSLQYHNQKDETIFLWSGRMLFEIKEGDELVKREMKPGEAVHVTPLDRPSHDGDRGLRCLRGLDAGAARRRPSRRSIRQADVIRSAYSCRSRRRRNCDDRRTALHIDAEIRASDNGRTLDTRLMASGSTKGQTQWAV